jgi:hypothetical protein
MSEKVTCRKLVWYDKYFDVLVVNWVLDALYADIKVIGCGAFDSDRYELLGEL